MAPSRDLPPEVGTRRSAMHLDVAQSGGPDRATPCNDTPSRRERLRCAIRPRHGVGL